MEVTGEIGDPMAMVPGVMLSLIAGRRANLRLGRRINMLNIKVVTWSLALFGAVTFLVCILYGLIVPEPLHMTPFLEQVLPGFRWLTFGGFVVGLAESFLYGAYAGALFSAIYNWIWKRSAQAA